MRRREDEETQHRTISLVDPLNKAQHSFRIYDYKKFSEAVDYIRDSANWWEHPLGVDVVLPVLDHLKSCSNSENTSSMPTPKDSLTRIVKSLYSYFTRMEK